jgi:GNAT superfamily N-acetyltransferase
MVHECHRGGFTISTDPARLDLDVIHGFLTTSYWSDGIPREVVTRALGHSLCFGAYEDGRQVGFARVITDRATFAYVADVFVLASHRGRGVGKHLMACIVAHPELQDLKLWTLFTRDAHGLYQQYGFTPARYPDRLMERRREPAYGPGQAEVATQGRGRGHGVPAPAANGMMPAP